MHHLRLKLAAIVLAVGSAGGIALTAGPAAAAVIAGPGAGGVYIPAAAPAGTSTQAVRGITKNYSYNWSGYAQNGKATKKFTAVKSYWTVPTVKAGVSGTQYSSDWVGVDGYSNSKLVQDGTEADNVNGKAQYSSWTEILPAASVNTPLTIHAGDKMEGLVEEYATNKWEMTVSDLTSGKSYTKKVSYTTPEQSAECVHERPEVGGSLANLAATSNVSFNPGDYSTAAAGKTPVWQAMEKAISGETVYQMFMINNADTAVIASPSLPNSAKDGFTVADGATSPPPPS